MKLAICYFGLLRTFKKAFESQKKLFQTLQEEGVDFDIYLHTWVGSLVHRRGNTDAIHTNDLNDIQLLDPKKYKVDNQDEFIDTLDMKDFYYEDAYKKYGESYLGEWAPDLLLFHLCSIESQRRVIAMAQKSGIAYDKILMIRPDVEFLGPFPTEIFQDRTPMKVFIPSHTSGEGYNDQLALFNPDEIEPYANRLERAKLYRAKIGRIVGERYLKYILDVNGFIVELADIPFHILRE